MDDDQLRRTAATRPGYATYPTTAPGSPSWWRREVPGAQGRPELDRGGFIPGPPTRMRLHPAECVLVIREGCGVICVRDDHQHDRQALRYGFDVPAPTSAPAAEVAAAPADGGDLAGTPAVISRVLGEHLPAIGDALTEMVAAPRRRWWHRLSRGVGR